MKRLDATFGTGIVPAPHAFHYGPGKPLISYHGAGLPLLLAPAAALTGSLQGMRLTIVVLAAVGALLLWLLLERLWPGSRLLRPAVWALVVLSLPVVLYATQLFPEIPAAVMALVAAVVLTDTSRRRWTLLCGGAAVAFMPWLHMRFALPALVLGLGLLHRAVSGGRRGTRAWIAVVAPALVSATAMVVLFDRWYGSPLPTAPLHGRSDASVTSTDAGFALQNAFHLSRVWGELSRLFFSAFNGLLPYGPGLLLGLVGLLFLVLRRRRWALVGLAGGLAYVVPIAANGVQPGYAFPGRFLIVAVPLLALPLLGALIEVPWLRALFWPLAAWSAAMTVLGVTHSGALYPDASHHLRPRIPGAGALLSAWPTLWNRGRDVTMRPAKHPSTGPETLVAARVPAVPAGRYRVVAWIGAAPADSPIRGPAARVTVAGPAHILASRRVPAGELAAPGLEPIALPLAVPDRMDVRIRVSTRYPRRVHARLVHLSRSAAYLTGTNAEPPDSGSGGVIGWTAAIVVLGGAAAVTTARQRRLGAVA